MTEYYVSGIIEKDGNCEMCADDVVHYWTLYERDSKGLSQAIADFYDRESAEKVMADYQARDGVQHQVSVLEVLSGQKDGRIAELEARVKELEGKHKVEINGANERCKLLFDAKNHWADRARAAEAELARMKAHGDPRINEVLHTAVATIYFNDSSDYLPNLFSIARCISPRIAELLSSDEKAAFDETARLSAIANNAPAIPAEPHPAVLQEKAEYLAVCVDNLAKNLKWESVSDAQKLLEVSALLRSGCQPQRPVVKLPEEHGTVFIGGVGVRVFSEPSIIEAIRAAGGEIAE